MNLFSQPDFYKASRRAIRIGGIAKNGFVFVNLLVYHSPMREQMGVKP
jgi:hypothetical protein